MQLKTFFDFCSGIGGGRLGLERCNFKCVGSSDTSRLANTTYDLLFPDKTDKNYGNLKRLNLDSIPDFDIMIAGFPCQSFSVIGRQTGTKDPRGQIIYYLIDILKNKQPKVFILENVKGLVSHDRGKTFKNILRQLEKAGYTIFHKVMNSIEHGVPHMRQRIYIIGFRKDMKITSKEYQWPEIQERVSIKDYLSPQDNYMSVEDYEWFTERYLFNDKNNGKYEVDEILDKDYLVVDTRMSDLRLYDNRMPTLRAHRDGIYYVYNHRLYYLTGEEALALQGFESKRIERVRGKVSNRHLLKQAGNAMTANVVEVIGNSIKNAIKKGKNNMNWKDFEYKSLYFLKENFGDFFELQGASNSTVSDILCKKRDKEFYIEAKDNPSQCGQFVLLPIETKQIFEFSPRNKTYENRYAKEIIKYMSDNYNKFCAAGTQGKDIEMDKNIFYKWIIDYYKNIKNVEYFITNVNEDFLIFPTEDFEKYFDVVGKYREKKSGSRSLNKSNIPDLEKALKKENIHYDLHDLKITSENNLANKTFYGEKYNYLLREDGTEYKVRMLSNTRNANVIFSIELKSGITKDILEKNKHDFKKYIE